MTALVLFACVTIAAVLLVAVAADALARGWRRRG